MRIHHIRPTKNAERFDVTDKVEAIQGYQQIWKNLQNNGITLHCTVSILPLPRGMMSWIIKVLTERKTKDYVGIHRTRLNDITLQNAW
jgi:hypothetical protein